MMPSKGKKQQPDIAQQNQQNRNPNQLQNQSAMNQQQKKNNNGK